MTVGTRIQFRRDTAANWTSNNPVLLAGEPGYETDTGKLKIGNGSSSWTGLTYWPGNVTSANLLSTGGWPGFESGVAGMISDNGSTTIAQSGAQFHGGTKSALMTCGTTGGMDLYANTGYPWDALVTAGNTYTFSYWSRAATVARGTYAAITWYDVSHAQISTVNGSVITNSTSAWTQVTASGAAPSNATAILCQAQFQAVTAGEQHYVDDGSLTNAT